MKILATKDYTYQTYKRGKQKFSIYMYNDDVNNLKFQISTINPYDDADYAWARCGYKGTNYVQFIKGGKVVDGMQLNYYEDEDYEDENEYLNEVIDSVCVELNSMNSSIKPKIIYD